MLLFPRLSTLLEIDVCVEETHCWAEVRCPESAREPAALLVALAVASDRCGNSPHYFNAWFFKMMFGLEHSDEVGQSLEAFVGSESIGTRERPSSDDHLEAFVAEHLWRLLTIEGNLGFGTPTHVEGPSWGVTDPGGDGLAIYALNGGLGFRLWESKAHGAGSAVGEVVSGACRQLDRNALRYLARYSKVGQSFGDIELQRFFGHLVDLWRVAAQEAGGGVSVSTVTIADIEACFERLTHYWEFENSDQRQGLVVLIGDYSSFAKRVREYLWKGL